MAGLKEHFDDDAGMMPPRPLDLPAGRRLISPPMRALGVLLLVLMVVGAFARPASAEPCPLHAHGQVRVAEASDGWMPQDAGPAEQRVVFEIGTLGSLWPAERPDSHHSVPDGQVCCHIAADTTPVVVGVTGDSLRMPQCRVRPTGWLRPHTSPAADIFRPPRLT